MYDAEKYYKLYYILRRFVTAPVPLLLLLIISIIPSVCIMLITAYYALAIDRRGAAIKYNIFVILIYLYLCIVYTL